MGGLTLEDMALTLTNVYENTEKLDLYTHISKQLTSWITSNLKNNNKHNLKKCYFEFYNEVLYDKRAFIKNPTEFEKILLSFNRNTWKHYIMTWAYNKGTDSQTITFLKEELYLNQSIYNKYPKIIKIVAKIIRKVRSIIKNDFPKVATLKTFLELISHISYINNEPITFDISYQM